jgi:glycosyltransferase involved in cell wall biosynthesis
MKVALVHDYIKEFGGAERVLKVLSEIFPKAPIYTAFRVRGSSADREFKGKDIRESKFAPLLKIGKLYSPFRFLTPWVWRSMDLSEYDLVITSCSWYITRGFKVSPKTKVIAYCHTPPRWLYGYETSVGFTKYWPVKAYSAIVGHFLRIYDFNTAQEIDYWIANSQNVRKRIEKFYRKDAAVIYPPVDVGKIASASRRMVVKSKGKDKDGEYFLMVSRLVGAKGLEETAKAFNNLDYKLKIAGEAHGFSDVETRLNKMLYGNVELLGRVPDKKLYKLYAGAIGFIALAKEEDFGMTPVEAQAAGTPVIAYNGGGFRESVIGGKTGLFVNEVNSREIKNAVQKLLRSKWNKRVIEDNAKRFSRKRFEDEVTDYIKKVMN